MRVFAMATSALSDDDVRDIAGRASTIDERLAGLAIAEEPADDTERERAHNLLSEWRRVAVAGDDRLFAKRIRRGGLDEQTALHLFARARLPADLALPHWACVFHRVLARTDEAYSLPLTPSREDKDIEPTPFQDLLWPIVVAARQLLAKRAGDFLPRLFVGPAIAALEHSLLLRLADLCSPGLFGDFSLFRHLTGHRRGRFSLPFSAPGSRVIYEAYVEAWRSGRCRDFFLAHPVAARLIGVTVSHWVECTNELIERLARDLTDIGDTFHSGLAPGQVEMIDTDLSDPHRGGRTVAILGFTSGLRLVYKPKDLRIDAAWSGLLGWLNDRGAPVRLKPVQVLVRDGYGWAEFIRADKRADRTGSEPDRATFYRRAGGLLALLHMSRATDFHFENVISSGGFPVPIDLESLVHPELASPAGANLSDPASALATSLLRASVLATLYLPSWMWGAGGKLGAIGGLDDPIDPGTLWTRFARVNTDAMAIAAPVFNDETESAVGGATLVAAYFRDFMAGFDELYAFLVDNRASLLEPDGPLTQFRGLIVRVILKPTRTYYVVQRRARAYSNLGNGAAWSLYFDYLLRVDLMREVSPEGWAISAAERAASAQCDIPMFTAQTDATWLEANPAERIESCVAVSPYDQFLARIQQLGDEDRLLQERLINSTIAPPRVDRYQPLPAGSTAPDLRDMAIRLGRILEATAIRSGDHIAWYGVNPIDHDHHSVWVLDIDLFAGTTGVAVFLAALAHATGEARFRDLALAAATPARARLSSDLRAHLARTLGIGGGIGVGSIIYGLVRMAGWLDEPNLLNDARSMTRLLDAELIAADRSLDVVKGAAGAILGLLTLHRASSDATGLAAAVACGHHLLRSRDIDRDGNLGWSTHPGKTRHLTGISHGAAGIALALLRLYRATGDADFRAAAEQALAYERKMFMPRSRNWPDLRFRMLPDGADTTCQWCHGGSGIGLARLGCLDLIDDDHIRGEIEAALSTTLAASSRPMDQLCCGNLGRIDFLLTAGLRLSRPDLVACARERATALVEQAVRRGQFAWDAGDDRMNPGFFQGISGIGYQLLRLTEPETLPSILLWN
jgi:type 2 lantibiotic biosynthesis protein LanM